MPPTAFRLAASLAALALLLAGCLEPAPSPSPTVAAIPTASPTAVPSVAPTPGFTPSPTPAPPLEPFPLAVVTGLTNNKAATTVEELRRLARDADLVVPCGLTIVEPEDLASPEGRDVEGCVEAAAIPAAIRVDPTIVALLPPGLVEPLTKLLPIDGDGPFGLGGADLFGSAESRDQLYPIVARANPGGQIDASWAAYDPESVWTLASLGGSCLDRNVAYAALVLGKGWDWVMDGGTARYRSIHLHPNPPAGVSRELIVDAVASGNRGSVARLVAGADVTLDDFDCTVTRDWQPNYGRSLFFSTSAKVLPLLRDKLGIDVMKLAGNHATDRGTSGLNETLRLLEGAGILGVGVGSNLDEALEPVYLDVAGVKVAFVSWNAVPGSVEAGDDRAGVAWLRRVNVVESVRRAREAGARLVLCTPEWWGGAEYHMDVRPSQHRQLGWMDEAGCDHVLGHGTHLAGPLLLGPRSGDGPTRLVVVSHGNFLFGQDWWQEVQEGMIVMLSFRGPELVNVRLHPYVMLLAAQASLTDPEGDGRHVLRRVWRHSEIADLDP